MSRWHERDFEAEDEAGYPRGRERGGLAAGLARLGFVAGAVVVVAASVWFGFRHSADVTDEASLPLIKADPRPLKFRPAQPGGMEVPNQDKLVFDRLDPGAAPPMVERLLPPPEVPMPRPVAPVTPPPPAADSAAGKAAARTAMDSVMAPPPVPLKSGLPEETAPPLATVPVAPPAPVVVPPPVATGPAKPAPAPAQAHAAPPAPAPTASAPATPAPAKAAPPVKAAPAAAKPAPLAPSGGNVRIQVGAVPREADAQTEWKRLQARHREQLGNLSLTVVRADLGDKGVYFRLQAGPIDEGRARLICDQLKSQNVGCQLARN